MRLAFIGKVPFCRANGCVAVAIETCRMLGIDFGSRIGR